MKKILVTLLLAGATGLVASCDANTGGNTTNATQDAEQMDGNMSGSTPTTSNDTTGAAATEKTQQNVGNSQTRGEANTSNSSTTQNVVVGKDSAQ
ncbi:hypothetical protein GU926_06700 [Nibribacter ruber]|uniref:Entericidin n=1 Tax=Nibribacter ruber TaxID=2698458 RepID=A0A6P1NYM8_9BACT|nr:hypothetical protein [Nibribacter ruber]QHL87135.1 hypothetical protein GU926_06700 [Nibribacter ruber]